MGKVKTIITYVGLAVFLGVVGLIVYANINDHRQRAAQEQTTPQREYVPPSPTNTPLVMSDSLISALDAISSERMFSNLEILTSFQAHSGWRSGGTIGEREALDYVESQLQSLDWLKSTGMEIERETFNVFLASDDRTSSVYFFVDDQVVEIPADAIRGTRDDLSLILNMDSDAQLNDADDNPVVIEGETVLIPDKTELENLKGTVGPGKLLFVDYSLVDTINGLAVINANSIMDSKPGAVIVVTHNSNTVGENHGSFVGDSGGVFQRLTWNNEFPLLFIEMENLAPLGIADWDGMTSLTKARLEWDADVFNPSESGNLIVHIPGKDTSKAILISAHIDSPNSPGALDDGSGSAILMEIADVLNEKHVQPDVDLYLAWYGSEELGIYGSMYFTTTHSDLMNRLQANVQIDCLSHPMDGLPANITLMFSHLATGDMYSDAFAKYMQSRGDFLSTDLSVTFEPFASDNGSLSAFDIPNVNIIYESHEMNEINGGVWVTGHFHDPYDTVELAREMEEPFVNMAKLAMKAALVSADQAEFVEHAGDMKAVFLANHTESPHMTPAGFPEFTLALIDAGYEISVIPYGRALAEEDLAGADLVVVLPTYDYAAVDAAYDTGWSTEEARLVDAYAQNGGRVLVINSSHRLKLYNRIMEENEDWRDLNTLTSQWGVEFKGLGSESDTLNVEDRGLLDGTSVISITPENAVSFSIESGKVLAGMPTKAYLAQIEVGQGEVIILCDMTILGESYNGLINPVLVKNLAGWE